MELSGRKDQPTNVKIQQKQEVINQEIDTIEDHF